ncbi:MAG TPA: leucine--tRNA ligase [Candidatus Aminicenantes bacterium]|nr:leucine--tRNA ligase [Candidatus Aminicenantes bacterium]HRY64321.1 leucine--tRNA ligase [Candidatus Aminicenantes bacterium]HRZ71234.1 leucine--tRNA ligase [Candidatus Aminicenantes bacterium]
MIETYDFAAIEAKWQKAWAERRAFAATEDPARPKFYCLEMYPYPSGRIHMGHVRNYSIGDVIARQKRMAGANVLHPIGWDALGMPAENAAIKRGTHPQTWTLGNVAHMRTQLQRLGISYDWDREVNTCLPEYYKWNQWIFLRMLERGLAFRKESWVNWCPQCRTVLANEQVVGGGCWRCETPVTQKKMEQWFLKITAYADELLSGHAALGKWPEHVLQMQKNWIGKSTGAHVRFGLEGTATDIEVFTTRIDTIYGATFLVVSAEHPVVAELIRGPREKELGAWVARTAAEMRKRRDVGETEKDGVDTGRKAVNPFTGERIPIWIANYVLMDYGTGAIMGVPAHDARDFEFAKAYGIPIRTVIAPPDKAGERFDAEPAEPFEEPGVLVNSGPFSGLPNDKAMEEMGKHAEDKGFGRRSTIFRLRDWGISRQRYWGTPIPVIYCDRCGVVGVPDKDLPVELPFDVEFTGEEGSPLERLEGFVHATCPKCGGPARRETDTMDTFVDSSWYFFRYCSPRETSLPFRPEDAKKWLPVDLYIGGVEHAILHLIYSRFFTKVLRDLGMTDIAEPFPHYLAQGMVTKDGSAMSKSKGNIVDPDEIFERYGADAMRVFILFASPPDKEFAWAEEGLDGCYRFLVRVWTIVAESLDLFAGPAGDVDPSSALVRKVHQTVRKVTEDIGVRFHLNTAVSSIMELYNMTRRERDAMRQTPAGRAGLRLALETMIRLLSPFAPHLAEELWERTGHAGLLMLSAWPDFDQALAREEMATIVVQVNGKVRDRFETEPDTPEAGLEAAALALPKIQAALGGRTPRKVIAIRDKLVNIVG